METREKRRNRAVGMRRAGYSYDRSSDFALLEAQFRLLRPNARRGVSSFFLRVVLILALLTRGSPILFSLLCLTCPPASLTRPRPQFPPILFSKQVCKTQFSCRLTSHLIARWSMLSLFSSSLLRSVHNFSLYFSLTPPPSLSQSSACHFFSSTNNSFFRLHSRQRSWRGDK